MTVDQYLLIILVVILVVIFHRRYVVVFIITIRSIAAAVLEFVFVVVLWLWHGRNWSFISSTTKKIKVRIDSPPITQTRTNPLGYQKHFVLWTSHIDHDVFIIDIIYIYLHHHQCWLLMLFGSTTTTTTATTNVSIVTVHTISMGCCSEVCRCCCRCCRCYCCCQSKFVVTTVAVVITIIIASLF